MLLVKIPQTKPFLPLPVESKTPGPTDVEQIRVDIVTMCLGSFYYFWQRTAVTQELHELRP